VSLHGAAMASPLVDFSRPRIPRLQARVVQSPDLQLVKSPWVHTALEQSSHPRRCTTVRRTDVGRVFQRRSEVIMRFFRRQPVETATLQINVGGQGVRRSRATSLCHCRHTSVWSRRSTPYSLAKVSSSVSSNIGMIHKCSSKRPRGKAIDVLMSLQLCCVDYPATLPTCPGGHK